MARFFEADKIHYEGHLKGWGPGNLDFYGPEMATRECRVKWWLTHLRGLGLWPAGAPVVRTVRHLAEVDETAVALFKHRPDNTKKT
jgi:hypothetical protein